MVLGLGLHAYIGVLVPDVIYLTCNTILHSVHYIIHHSAISKNTAVDYQSISQHDIIFTGMNCTMI